MALVAGLLIAGTLWNVYFRNADSEVVFAKAEDAIAREDWEAAKRLLEECLERDPNHVAARLYTGQFLRDAGQTDRAVEVWQSIREGSAGELATARYLEGSVAIERSHVDLARDLLQKSVLTDTCDMHIWIAIVVNVAHRATHAETKAA